MKLTITYALALLLFAFALMDWRANYEYKPFGRYLLDEANYFRATLP